MGGHIGSDMGDLGHDDPDNQATLDSTLDDLGHLQGHIGFNIGYQGHGPWIWPWLSGSQRGHLQGHTWVIEPPIWVSGSPRELRGRAGNN